MNKKVQFTILEVESRIASVMVGDDKETDVIRIHRYRPSISVWDLTNAGKRGKQVDRFSVDTDRASGGPHAEDLIEQLEKAKSYADALSAAEKWAESNAVKVYKDQEKGINVAPKGFKPIGVKGKNVYVSADYNSFHVRDQSDINEETCIPAIKGGKADNKVFYRWLMDNHEKVKSMDFNEVCRAMSDNGIRYHRYCALD